MSLDRAIMLPHEFDKKEEDLAADAGVSVLHRSTRTSVGWPRENGESPNDGKRNS